MTLFISSRRAHAARTSVLSRRLADTAQLRFRTGRDTDGSAWAGYVVMLFKAGRFIGHADLLGNVSPPVMPVYSA